MLFRAVWLYRYFRHFMNGIVFVRCLKDTNTTSTMWTFDFFFHFIFASNTFILVSVVLMPEVLNCPKRVGPHRVESLELLTPFGNQCSHSIEHLFGFSKNKEHKKTDQKLQIRFFGLLNFIQHPKLWKQRPLANCRTTMLIC